MPHTAAPFKRKQLILIVDDSDMNRMILSDMLGDEYEILEAENGLQAIRILQRRVLDISLVLLDIVMPEMDGFQVLSIMKKHRWSEAIPVVMISAERDTPQIARAYDLGAADFIPRPFDSLVVRRRVVNTILLYAKQKKLTEIIADQIYEKERLSTLMIDILSHIVEFRNGESGLHILHVRTLTDLLLRQLEELTSRYAVTPAQHALIVTASALHDIGKIAIDDKILNKPGRLTDEEFQVMKTHAPIGADMLEHLPDCQHEPLVRIARDICRWHHERYDGRGYPDGLRGDEIPISAQVVSLADVYDALTSERVYKKPFSHETAMDMILSGKCGVFNPLLLDCLRQLGDHLPEDLRVPAGSHPRPSTLLLSQELLTRAGMSDSARPLRLMEHELLKSHFFASTIEEIQFEYVTDPAMLTFSPWGARRLQLPEIIMAPRQDKGLAKVLAPADWDALSATLRRTTPSHPDASYTCRLTIDGVPRWYRLDCQTMWGMDASGQYTGTIGRAVALPHPPEGDPDR